MKNNKKIMLSLTMVAIIAVAAIGIGYAYTASTTNTGNNVSSEFITLVQYDAGDSEGMRGAYTFASDVDIFWNTADNYDGIHDGDGSILPLKYVNTKYTMAGTSDTIVSGYSLVKLGDSFKLKTQRTGGDTNSIFGHLTSVGLTKDANAELFVIIEQPGMNDQIFKLVGDDDFNRGPTFEGNDIFEIGYGASAYNECIVTVYYGYVDGGTIVPHAINAVPTGPSGTPIQAEDKIIFTADTDAGTLTSYTVTITNNIGANAEVTGTLIQKVHSDSKMLQIVATAQGEHKFTTAYVEALDTSSLNGLHIDIVGGDVYGNQLVISGTPTNNASLTLAVLS